MKVYKVILLVLSINEELEEKEIKDVIESVNYPNDCITVEVHDIESADVGEWHDDHPLNQRETYKNEWRRIFPSLPAGQKAD